MADTNEHPSFLIQRMWQLSTEQSVYLIWVVLGELGVLLKIIQHSSKSIGGRLLLKLYPVSAADLWCERTAKTGWMIVGLML